MGSQQCKQSRDRTGEASTGETVSGPTLSGRMRTGSAQRLRVAPLASMPVEDQTPEIEDRTIGVQTLLADSGRHRAPSIPDLIVAATAELVGLVGLHLDKNSELIIEITGQPTDKLSAAP